MNPNEDDLAINDDGLPRGVRYEMDAIQFDEEVFGTRHPELSLTIGTSYSRGKISQFIADQARSHPALAAALGVFLEETSGTPFAQHNMDGDWNPTSEEAASRWEEIAWSSVTRYAGLNEAERRAEFGRHIRPLDMQVDVDLLLTAVKSGKTNVSEAIEALTYPHTWRTLIKRLDRTKDDNQ